MAPVPELGGMAHKLWHRPQGLGALRMVHVVREGLLRRGLELGKTEGKRRHWQVGAALLPTSPRRARLTGHEQSPRSHAECSGMG